jgi:ubiquitin-conjugating enzyme E2 D/E
MHHKLRDEWTPTLNFEHVVLLILSLFERPDLTYCKGIDKKIAEIYHYDRLKYEATAREWTYKFAK